MVSAMVDLLSLVQKKPAHRPGTLVCLVSKALKPPLTAYRMFPLKGLDFSIQALVGGLAARSSV
jgi:hypothetical protein